MQQSNAPAKLVLPFANSGAKNTIPADSQIGVTPGAASLTDGFPPLTRTPLVSGGVPPSGLDMNGILFALAAIDRWTNAGGRYPYDSAFATNDDVNGYPKGAVVLSSDGVGGWLNTVDNNETDPEAGGAGWVPDFQYGKTAITMTNANVTLNSLQAGKPVIEITGVLTANLNLNFPTYVKPWTVINKCTGNFTITCKTVAGTGVALAIGQQAELIGDGTNILSIASIASAAEAQAFTANRLIDGARLASAFQGSNQLLNGNGYQKLPGGLIVQWFLSPAIPASSNGVATFPIAFPTGVLGVNATFTDTINATRSFGTNISALSASSITLRNPDTNPSQYRIIVIGY